MEQNILICVGIVAVVLIGLVVLGFVLATAKSPVDRIREAIDRGDHQEALRLGELCLDADPDDLTRAMVLDEVSSVHRFRGDHAAAVKCCRRALKLRRKFLPPDHRDIGVSEFNIGLSLLAGSKLAEAEPFFRRAVSVHRISPDSTDADLAFSLKGLSQSCGFLGRLDEAAALLAEAIAIADRSLDELHPFAAEIRLWSAQLHMLRGRYYFSDRDFRRATLQFERLGGLDQPMRLTAMQQHANLKTGWHRLTGDAVALEEAETLIDDYRERCETNFGLDHQMTAEAYRTLSRVRALQGLFPEAVEAARFALKIGETLVGADHLATCDKRLVLCRALDDIHAFDEAAEQARAALRIMEGTFGPDHVELGDPLELLGRIVYRQGRSEEAEQHLRRSLALRAPLGPMHPLRAFALRELVPILHATGRRVEAGEAELEIAAIIRHAKLGESEEDTANAVEGQVPHK